MRHRMQHRKLGRTSAHRTALFRNQLTALFTHERIVTTVAKAKELRPLAERMVTLARTGTLANRRRILTMVPDSTVVGRLFEEIAPRFTERPGGYTRIVRLGRRHGDNAELALIEFVDFKLETKKAEKAAAAEKRSLMDRAKGMLGGHREGAEGAHGEPEVETAAEPDEADATSEKKTPKKTPKKAAKKAEDTTEK